MNTKYINFAAEKLRKSGFTDIEIVADDEMGADITATAKSGSKVCVCCRYTDKPVTANTVQEIYQAKQNYGCNAAMVITNGTFTPKAEEYAAKTKVVLKPSVLLPVSAMTAKSEERQVSTPRGAISCPECGSSDIEMKVMQENQGSTVITKSKTKGTTKSGHGCLWWIFIGWWWWMVDLFIWMFAFLPRLLIQIFKGKKTRSKSKTTSVSQEVTHIEYKTICMCRACGHHWKKQ